MRPRLFVLTFAVVTAFIFSITSTCSATVLTFDDLSETGSGSFLANGYQGLSWSNFGIKNAVLYVAALGSNGFYSGIVSASNVTYNGLANPAEINSSGTNFNFLSAYLTGAVNSNLNVEVEGFRGASLVYSQVVVASATAPTLFAFNYLNIDRLHFNAFGGEPAFGTAPAEYFVMDNFTFAFIPEPSTVLLTAAGALLLWPLLKRKRA